MRTTETFQQPTMTVRTKKCRACGWTFTSIEQIAESVVIPTELRDSKRKSKPVRRRETGGTSQVTLQGSPGS